MIPVSDIVLRGNEKKYLNQAIDENAVSSGGRFVREFEEAFARWSGNDYAIAVSSGSAALETAVRSTDYPKDHISVPSGTIISCYHAVHRAGYEAKLHDNDSTGACIGIMRCHLFGRLDKTKGFPLVDDLSQYWKPFRVDFTGAYSLYANKMITAGEGGVVVTNDLETAKRARSYRNLCHGDERFKHTDYGFNYRMSNLQAAVALAQLEQINDFVDIKQKNRDLYKKYFIDMEDIIGFDVPVPWMYLIITPMDAGELQVKLHREGVDSRRFFYPIHLQDFLDIGGYYPNAEYLWKHALYIPSGITLTKKEILDVSSSLRRLLRSV